MTQSLLFPRYRSPKNHCVNRWFVGKLRKNHRGDLELDSELWFYNLTVYDHLSIGKMYNSCDVKKVNFTWKPDCLVWLTWEIRNVLSHGTKCRLIPSTKEEFWIFITEIKMLFRDLISIWVILDWSKQKFVLDFSFYWKNTSDFRWLTWTASVPSLLSVCWSIFWVWAIHNLRVGDSLGWGLCDERCFATDRRRSRRAPVAGRRSQYVLLARMRRKKAVDICLYKASKNLDHGQLISDDVVSGCLSQRHSPANNRRVANSLVIRMGSLFGEVMAEIRRSTAGDSSCTGLRVLAGKLPATRRSCWFLLLLFLLSCSDYLSCFMRFLAMYIQIRCDSPSVRLFAGLLRYMEITIRRYCLPTTVFRSCLVR